VELITLDWGLSMDDEQANARLDAVHVVEMNLSIMTEGVSMCYILNATLSSPVIPSENCHYRLNTLK